MNSENFHLKMKPFSASPGQDVEIWISQFEMLVSHLKEQSTKIATLFLNLEGEPLRWFHENKKSKNFPEHLDEVLELLQEEYGKPPEPALRMHPDQTLPNYRDKLVQILRAVRQDDDEIFIKNFKEGLTPQLKLAARAYNIHDMESLRLFIREMKSSDYNTQHTESTILLPAFHTTRTMVKLTLEEREKCLREGLCLRCRKPGHVARECPNFPNRDHKQAHLKSKDRQ